MDDVKYERSLRVFQLAKISAVLAASITAFIAFCAFQLAGFAIMETAAWMFALSLMCGSALFVAMYVTYSHQLKKEERTTQPAP